MTPMPWGVVERIPELLERVRREIVLARFIGKLAVDRGVEELVRRFDPTTPEATPAPVVDRAEFAAADASPSTPAVTPVDTPDVPAPPDVADLALSDYDHLPSAHIVAKLDGLEESELDAIEAYERAGRHRRTILGKLERLRTETAS